MSRARTALIWSALAVAVVVPIALAAGSPLLQWRQPIYIAAGFAGIVAMGLLLVQPLLAGGYLPRLSARHRQRAHRLVGCVLVAAVLVHVVGLWITSPPDVIDALLFRSPTPFSAWGVIAMWAVFAAALLAALRRRLRQLLWRRAHTIFASVTVVGSVTHAMLIEGTMEIVSKALLCALVLAAMAKAVVDRRVWIFRPRRTG